MSYKNYTSHRNTLTFYWKLVSIFKLKYESFFSHKNPYNFAVTQWSPWHLNYNTYAKVTAYISHRAWGTCADTGGERALVVAFNHRVQNQLVSRWVSCFPPSSTSFLCTRVWNWSQHITYLTATPCLKPDKTGFMFDCWSIRLSSIVKVFDFRTIDCVRLAKCFDEFDYVRLPNRTPWSKSIERLEFDWVRLPNVRLTTSGIIVWDV